MPETSTFFRNRSADDGETYHFRITAGAATHDMAVYTRSRGDSQVFRDREIPQKGLNGAVAEIEKAVVRSGGGVLVRATEEGAWRTLDVRFLGETERARTVLLLTAAYPPRAVAADGKIRLPEGAHVIVPVDRDAEERLRDFVAQLTWFSPDFESLVLDAIRRPALDARLADVEKQVFGTARNTTSGRLRRAAVTGGRMLLSPVVQSATIACLLVMLLAVNVFGLLRTAGTSTPPVSQSAPPVTPAVGAPLPVARVSAPVDPLASAAKALIDAVHDKAPSNDTFRVLYDTHFKNIEDSEIAAAFTRPANNHQRALLMGIIKLQVLKLQGTTGETSFVAPWNTFELTNHALETLHEKARADDVGRRMVAALACSVGGDKLVPADSCDGVCTANIEPGIRQLIDYVNHS
jgi:hypothetical protein